jgi:CRISPR-associated exonuclease Cas4
MERRSTERKLELLYTLLLMDDFIFLSALNQYDYCPRRYYYMFIENVFAENEHTVEGALQHERSDSGERSLQGEALQLRSVYLYSRSLGICGKADVIEEKNGEIYPVEHKKGRRGTWTNDELQLCAQGLCLEEMLGRPVDRGYLFYSATGRRKEVRFSAALRDQTVSTIQAIRRLSKSGERPPNLYTPRCRGCSLHGVCLPKETKKLKETFAGVTGAQ